MIRNHGYDRNQGSKKLNWMGRSRAALRAFSDQARNIAGNQLWMAQLGREPDDWKSIPQVGRGAIEIRIHRPHEHRVIYVAKFPEAIYVLHAFEKKSEKTSTKVLKVAQKAYREMETLRSEEKENTNRT